MANKRRTNIPESTGVAIKFCFANTQRLTERQSVVLHVGKRETSTENECHRRFIDLEHFSFGKHGAGSRSNKDDQMSGSAASRRRKA
jgi:hypothetical protein